jgi:flagellar basal-body rod modification protein FlgD
MSDTSDIGALTGLGLGPRPQSGTPRNQLDQQAFFDLMVAQLRYQDPINPLESNEFLGQMAQFATVSGVQEMQRGFAELASALQSSQALQASTLVGRRVLVSSDRGPLVGSGPLTGAVDLPQASELVTLTISRPNGEVVRRINLDGGSAGLASFSWDGKTDDGNSAPPGTYTLHAVARYGHQDLGLETLIGSKVESVTLERGGMTLKLAGMDGVGLSQVREIY